MRPQVKNEEAVKPRPEANPAFRLSVTVEPPRHAICLLLSAIYRAFGN